MKMSDEFLFFWLVWLIALFAVCFAKSVRMVPLAMPADEIGFALIKAVEISIVAAIMAGVTLWLDGAMFGGFFHQTARAAVEWLR